MEMTTLVKPLALKRGTFLGECYCGTDYIGDRHRAEGGYRVLRVEYGKVLAQSPIMPGSVFRRAGSMQLSASQSVNRYKVETALSRPMTRGLKENLL